MTFKLRSRKDKAQKSSTENRRSSSARILTASAICAISLLGTGVAPASALPSTTSWTNAGLQNMVIETGNVSASVDGCGDRTDSLCSIDILKPGGATVRKAYFVIASGMNYFETPTQVKLEQTTITFTHKASETRNPPTNGSTFNFTNHLADVTSLIKPIVDANNNTNQTVQVDYSLDNSAGLRFSGAALTVIFDDPSAPQGSVLYNFGTTSSAGESFAMSFSPVVKANLSAAWLSVGIGWSADGGSQVTRISVSPNGRPNTVLSGAAGGINDGLNITVGGVGDDTTNPASTSNTATDDELYSLQPLLEDGDTSFTISTQNLSNDDNLFQAVMYLPTLLVSQVTIGTAFAEGVAVTPPASAQTSPTTPATTPVAAAPASSSTPALRLATTGTSGMDQLWLIGAMTLIGSALLGLSWAQRRKIRAYSSQGRPRP